MTTTTKRTEAFTALLEQRGVDLSRLRGSRGMVHCMLPGHDDGVPSLSVDLDAAVFHCFGCHAGGGLVHLRALLGKDHPSPRDARSAPAPRASRGGGPMGRRAPVVAGLRWRAASSARGRVVAGAGKAMGRAASCLLAAPRPRRAPRDRGGAARGRARRGPGVGKACRVTVDWAAVTTSNRS